MWPEPLFSLWGWSINLYVILIALGALAALELVLYLGWERGLDLFLSLGLWFIGIGGLLLGGDVLREWIQRILPGQGRWSLAWISAILILEALLIASRRDWRARAHDMLDVVAPAVALGQAIGRLGCFAAGCCYGLPAPGLPWGVTFTGNSSAARYPGLPLHPVQLYESFGCLLITILLLKLHRHPTWQGQLVWLYLVAYGALRFVVEFFRGDPRPMVGLLSLNQVICLGFIAIGGAFLMLRARALARPSHLPLAPLARSAD
ncbi:MAG: prolipoprotein diacylglyceryl transferase family protein [Anaerolineae bacterium]